MCTWASRGVPYRCAVTGICSVPRHCLRRDTIALPSGAGVHTRSHIIESWKCRPEPLLIRRSESPDSRSPTCINRRGCASFIGNSRTMRRRRSRSCGRSGNSIASRRARSVAVARGNLIVAMAPHVSRFIARLFGVGAEAESLVQATRAYDVLFRFKIDFVRRRALPLLKGGAHVTATPADHALVDEPCARRPMALAVADPELRDRARAVRLLAARSRGHRQGRRRR